MSWYRDVVINYTSIVPCYKMIKIYAIPSGEKPLSLFFYSVAHNSLVLIEMLCKSEPESSSRILVELTMTVVHWTPATLSRLYPWYSTISQIVTRVKSWSILVNPRISRLRQGPLNTLRTNRNVLKCSKRTRWTCGQPVVQSQRTPACLYWRHICINDSLSRCCWRSLTSCHFS